jgi:serine/threonine protein kinase
MQTASNQLQDMMTRVKHFVVDFAYLKTGRKIGDGASARVYEGVYRGNKVAIKVSTPNELSDEVMEAFATETKIMIGLEHKNVVKFYGICVKPPQIGLVVELCPKGDLKSNLMSEPKYWTFNRKLRAALECASGLAYLHDNKIIHRDIKINNFFITENYSIKLGDFGESTVRRETDNRRMSILGTVSYMSPELVAADKNYTSAVDIYALGITLCEIFSGEVPFANIKNFLKIYESITKGDRPDLPKDIPIELKNIIEVHFFVFVKSFEFL